jgi:hypothetical protein
LSGTTRSSSRDRTLINLRALQQIYEAHKHHADPPVRFVTHIVNSLLGLVVFTAEKKFVRFTVAEKLSDLPSEWPRWKLGVNGTQNDTLGELAYHLRNAACHARVFFSSDSHDPKEVEVTFEDVHPKTKQVYWRASILAEVEVTFEDVHPKTKQVYWRASILASELLTFCFLYAEHLDQVIN